MSEKDDKKPTILVIGDWFIDENWLMAKHNAYSSSHTGDIHFLSRHDKIEKRMISLCGVSEILEALRSNIDKYSFIGLGVWNKNDDEILQCVLCPNENSRGKLRLMTPYTIGGLKDIKRKEGRRMCPYSDKECTYQPQLINLALDEKSSTNRIIRVFEGHGGGQPHLLYRFDWELPVSGLDYAKLHKSVADKDIEAIVIEDHDKGFITKTTIEKLVKALGRDTLKKIKWYIRSKVEDPPWLGLFKELDINVRLRIIDHRLALHKKGPRLWRYGKVLGRASLELLGELSGANVYIHAQPVRKEGFPAERVAVLFDDNTVIAKDGNNCFNLYNSPGPKQLINIGRTTIFFCSLIHQDIQGQNQESFGSQCSYALQCAYEWSKEASNAWNKDEPYFYGNYKTALTATHNRDIKEGSKENYDDAWKDWNDSSLKLGILKEDKFQLWRGEGAIKNYISTGGPKRDRINELLSRISQFNEQKEPKHPFNCLLVSSPGWGKSFLAKSIAKYFEMSYMEFSISQMATTQDLVDCFDSICSHQNRTEKKVLIFMDEVNCQIEGNLAMGLLLSPIWDGSFIRNGKYYRLSPAVWIFASTEPIETLTSDGNNKGSDFVSRLNGPIIELDSLERPGHRNLGKHLSTVLKKLTKKIVSNPNLDVYDDEDYEFIMSDDKGMPYYIRTDQVYLCVSLLNKFWGPISKIQKEVLQLCYEIVPINGVRSIEFFIFEFQNIQRGIVCCSNVPVFDNFPELKRHIILPKEWKEYKQEDDKNSLIDIETLI